MTKNKIKNIILSAVSVTISILFIAVGLSIALDKPPFWILTSGYLISLYGILSTILLVLAWKKSKLKTDRMTKYLTAGFLAFIILTSLDVGRISPLEWAAIILIAPVLFVNWFTVKRIIRENYAQQGNRGDGE